MKESFNSLFNDKTSSGVKIKKEEYLKEGKYLIVDQGQNEIAGYSNREEGVFEDLPAIIFGDHTRVVKYINQPFFLGADGVKLLKCKSNDANYKYLYYALKNVKIPNTGYNRHFKWLKEVKIIYPDKERQNTIVKTLESIEEVIQRRKKQLEELDILIKARFVEMFDRKFGQEKINVSDIATPIIGLTYKPENVSDKGILVLRSGNIQNQSLQVKDDIVRVSNIKIPENKYIQDKDILMCSRNGSARLVGKSCLIRKPKEKMSFGAFMTVVRTEYPYFMHGFFSSHYFKQQLTSVATTSVNQITSKMLNNYNVAKPSFDDEQQFADFVEQVTKSKLLV